jgi:hypothetical protein
VSPTILQNSMFAKMEDAEMVLRFFALRHVSNYRHGMQGFLDLYMRRSLSFTEPDVDILEKLFVDTLELASSVYGETLFRPYDSANAAWQSNPQKAFSDAVMVGFSELLDQAERIRERATEIRAATADMFAAHDEGTFTGRGNTKEDVQTRIRLFREMITKAIG